MNTRHFSQLPKPYLAYPKVIQGLILKKPKAEKVLPQVEYVVDSFKVDQKHLKAYNEVCGFKNNGYIPAIYLTVLSQSLQMHMMTAEAFPFPVLRSEEHTSELQSRENLVCRLLLEKKNKT